MLMTSTKTLTSIALALAISGAAVIGTGGAYAHEDGKRGINRWHRFEYRADIHKAIEDNDYERWRMLTEGKPIQDNVTNEEEFAQLVRAHELMEDGSFDEARTILDELGIKKPFHGGHHHKHGLGLEVFLQLNDDEAEKLDEARQLFQEGNETAARELIKEVRDSFKIRQAS